MLRFFHLGHLLICSAAWIAGSSSAAPPPASRIDIPVELGQGAYTTVEIAWPTNLVPRALVVVVPNSGGLADPYLNPELKRVAYDPDSRGGLTAKLLTAGYAVAYYGQRGYALPRTCIRGDTPAARAASFVQHCVDYRLRAGVSLSSITADTGRVFTALREHPRTGKLPQIALPFSEGMHHVSVLAGQGAIQPAGIVSIGGPQVPVSHVAWYQTSREHFAALARKAFARCPDKQLTVEKILSCAGSPGTPPQLDKMREFAGGEVLSRDFLPLRQQMFRDIYRLGLHDKVLPENAILSASFEGHPMPVGWNLRYAQEQQNANKSTVEQLGRYTGKVIYLFGAQDYFFPLPAPGPCRVEGAKTSTPSDCSFRLVDGVGHGLEDASGFSPDAVLDEVVRALDEAGASAAQPEWHRQ